MTSVPTEIFEQSATNLAGRIARRELSAAQVFEAHIQRIEQVDPHVNAVVARLFEQARAAAAQADARQARGEALGPLHGVPITVKEMFDIAGAPTTAGLATRARHVATCDAVAVARMRRAGAIVLGKTNVPQMGMLPDASNPLYGRTKNPWNPDRTPGGSSGGEAAIIASGGSPLGLGSDGGGSIRQPCHSCGICGIKPTGRRLSFRGHWCAPNWLSDWVQPGPMARSVDDLGLALECLHEAADAASEWDACHGPLRDYRTVDVERLRVGFYTQLGWLRPAPAVSRAVEEAADFLRSDGVQVEPFCPPDVDQAWGLYFALFYADACRDLRRQARGNKLDWRIKRLFQFTELPTVLRPVLSTAFRWFGDRSIVEALGAVPKRVISAGEYTELLARQDNYRRRFAHAMQAQAIDVLIGPPCPFVAVTPAEFYVNYGMLYMGLFNLLAMPAGVVPATRVGPSEQHAARSRERVDRSMARVEAESAGLPVGVHVASRWWREDLVLAVMKRLERHFTATPGFPRTPVSPAPRSERALERPDGQA